MKKSNIFLTSDTHFNHNNLIGMCPESRGHFSNVEEMNETIIQNWNEIVPLDGIVYHLGDLCMGKAEDIPNILERLNGHIILIRGNHDYGKRRKIYEECGVEIKDIDYISYKGMYFVLSHIPIGNEEYMEMLVGPNGEIWNLHGHTHQYTCFSAVPHTFHVGLDSNKMKPISLEEVYGRIQYKLEFEDTLEAI